MFDHIFGMSRATSAPREASCALATTEAKLEFERQRRSDVEADVGWYGWNLWEIYGKSMGNVGDMTWNKGKYMGKIGK